jgi:hypothetical protein
MRGCDTPMILAARDWVSFLSFMKLVRAIIIFARMRRFSASAGGNPQSTKTFSLPLVVASPSPFQQFTVAFLPQLHV